jgi:hypothetical protein
LTFGFEILERNVRSLEGFFPHTSEVLEQAQQEAASPKGPRKVRYGIHPGVAARLAEGVGL